MHTVYQSYLHYYLITNNHLISTALFIALSNLREKNEIKVLKRG